MRPDDNVHRKLVAQIYDAAVEPTLWQDALVHISEATAAVGALYLAYDLRHPERSRHESARLDPELMHDYLTRHSRNHPWAEARTLPAVDEAVSLDALVPSTTLVRSAFYHDILRPQRILHGGAVCLARDAARSLGFCIFRGPEVGPVGVGELRVLSVLGPHVKRATQIAWRLGALTALEKAKVDALDRIDHGVMLLDAQARVLFANRSAEAILARRDGLTLPARVLRAAATADTQRLQALIASAATGSSGGTMRVARPSLAEPFLVLVAAAPSAGPWPPELQPAVILFVTDPERVPDPDMRSLMELFSLTATEARVALVLGAGDSVPETARALRLSANTIHTHMRRIFQKTGVNRQAELVRVLTLIATVLPPSFDRSSPPADGKARPAPRRQN